MSRGREALVGLVIVGAIAVTVVGTFWLQGASFSTAQTEMEAVFDQVGLLRPGNSLKFRGVEVGRVEEILVDPSGEAVRVSFQVVEGLTLPPDAVVILSPESLFGDWQAEIHPRGAYEYVEYAEPWEPGVLPGHALPDISQLTHAADRISANLAVLTERFGVAFSEETARNIASLIDNVTQVTEDLSELVRQQAASFTEVTSSVQRAVDGIASAADDASRTFQEASGTFQEVTRLVTNPEIEATLSDLAAISSNLRDLSAELSGTNVAVRDMAAHADSTFMRAESILARAEGGDGTLGQLLTDSTMADDLHTMVNELRVLLVDVRENPRRYLRLSIF